MFLKTSPLILLSFFFTCLLLLQFFPTADESIEYYNQRRCFDGKGLVLPSQIVSENYLKRILYLNFLNASKIVSFSIFLEVRQVFRVYFNTLQWRKSSQPQVSFFLYNSSIIPISQLVMFSFTCSVFELNFLQVRA